VSAVEPSPERVTLLELAVCALLVSVVALLALKRMELLHDTVGYHTDQTRTAYVAKNLVEGRGYTTNDLPEFMVDFYDRRGKLHGAHWGNAERFPFPA